MPAALISVYDKTGVQEFALAIAELGFDIYSTGGTQRALAQAGLPVHSVSSLTGFPEILDGRVKTLHPIIHAGILARRDKPEHMEELERSEIPPIDVVCANLYPFRETIARPGVSLEDALENIDIGGPAMIRAAAKNFPSVLVLVDPDDYPGAIDYLRMWTDGHSDDPEATAYRRALAAKAFQHVANYDSAVAAYLRSLSPRPEVLEGRAEAGAPGIFPQQLTVALELARTLRYGENPHQRAALYREDTPGPPRGLLAAEQLHGLEMSYLNYLDADAAWRAVCEFSAPTVVIVKHATPSGIASAADIASAYSRAFECDPISPFGGIIAANRTVTGAMVEAMKGTRYDVMIAPDYETAALERLRRRRDLRILRMPEAPAAAGPSLEYRSITGGLLVQERDERRAEDLELRVVTRRVPTAQELEDLRFAWACVRHVKSNAIVIARGGATVGIGAGQQNRLWPVEMALERAGERAKGAVAASDAFFPFARNDAVEALCRAGVTAIIQPGGAVRDEEAVQVCDEYGVAMVFTGTRAFRH
jgi:phosphoribosylaminoimidazolecarboxamide formyltransferase/IMP cyclohydrolase